jgi:hypothetical protein
LSNPAPATVRIVVAILSGVVLLLQITATRLLSATVSYHAAFVILALVMLALAASAAAVYRDRIRGADESGTVAPARAAVRGGIAIAGFALGYVAAGAIPWPAAAAYGVHLAVAGVGLYATFHACGYVTAWLFAAWPRDIGRVYFADLCGAAAGCAIVVPVLAMATPVQVFMVCALVTSAAGVLLGRPNRGFVRRYWAVVGVLGVLVALAFVAPTWLRLRSAKLQDQSNVMFEGWNQLARVTVSPDVPGSAQAIGLLEQHLPADEAAAQVAGWTAGWAMSDRWHGPVPKTLWIQLDSDAGTQIVAGGGTRPLSELEVLRWDVTSAAYWLRDSQIDRTIVLGGGGGRDILTALSFGARDVDVVELNPLVVHAVQVRFGDFSGRPYSRPGVHALLGEARNQLARSDKRYDVIQMSMIDTWAASMTGALTLSENALYTREAFRSYLEHLTDDGLLSVSRWYDKDRYGETGRVVALMGDALRSAGIDHVEDHVAVVFNAAHSATGVATCILKRSPFTADDRALLARMLEQTGFGLLWPEIGTLAERHAMDVRGLLAGTPSALTSDGYDMSPPADDRPFFFNTSTVLPPYRHDEAQTPVLFAILMVTTLLAGSIVIMGPLRQAERWRSSTGSKHPIDVTDTIYFAAVGASFMAVELALLQRYIVFLGHPSYALSVVLFSLLLSTAVGSLTTRSRPRWTTAAFGLLLVALACTAFVVPSLLTTWQPAPLAQRIAVAAALVMPLGVCMGAACPSGIRALELQGRERQIPWMWAVNGLAGTFASVAGMFLAMSAGYTNLLIGSTIGYALAWAAWVRINGRFVSSRDASPS